MSTIIFQGIAPKTSGYTETIEAATLPRVEALIREYFKTYPQHLYETIVLKIERLDTKVVALLQRKESPTEYQGQHINDYNYRNLRDKKLFIKH